MQEALSKLTPHPMALLRVLHGTHTHARWSILRLCDAPWICLNGGHQTIYSPDHQVHETI